MARLTKILTALLVLLTFNTERAQVVNPGPLMRTIAAAGGYSPLATTLAGDGQAYMSKTGFGADGNVGTFSVWVKFAQTSTQEYIVYSTGSAVRLSRESDNTFIIVLKDSGGTTLIQASSTATITADGNWHHVHIYWDRNNDNDITFVLDGTAGTSIATFLSEAEDADDIDYGIFQWFIGGLGGTTDMNGCLSEVYVNQAAEVTDTTLFRTAGGDPVDLGSDGSTPSGSQPIGYFKSIYSSFTVNSGSGGNFTKVGTTAFTECTGP